MVTVNLKPVNNPSYKLVMDLTTQDLADVRMMFVRGQAALAADVTTPPADLVRYNNILAAFQAAT